MSVSVVSLLMDPFIIVLLHHGQEVDPERANYCNLNRGLGNNYPPRLNEIFFASPEDMKSMADIFNY